MCHVAIEHMNCDHVYKLSPGPLEYSNTGDITAWTDFGYSYLFGITTFKLSVLPLQAKFASYKESTSSPIQSLFALCLHSGLEVAQFINLQGNKLHLFTVILVNLEHPAVSCHCPQASCGFLDDRTLWV